MQAVALIGFCALSWAAGTSLAAAPALASTCRPLGSTCAPDDFTGDDAGTLLASEQRTFAVTGAFNGTYTSAVYEESGGTLDFYLQASVDPAATDGVVQLRVTDFEGALADMGYRADGSSVDSALFVDGSQIPSTVSRGTSGDPVAWDFTGPDAVNSMQPGDTSMVLEVKTGATEYGPGAVSFTNGPDNDDEGAFAPVVTPMSSSASPAMAHTGTTLQDSATLAARSTLDGTGSITFNLYGPGDTTCSTSIHTEVVNSITSDGPWHTTTGYVATVPGTYQWVASFSGDSGFNASGATACGDEPVVVTRVSQVTPASTTCTQFASGTASTLSRATYSVARGKIKAVTPSRFSYWATVISTGGTQTYRVTEFTNETSRPFRLAAGSSVQTAGCAAAAASISQSGGVVTVKFAGGTAGTLYFINLNFATSGVVGEAQPAPSRTVRYLFKAGGSSPELDLVK